MAYNSDAMKEQVQIRSIPASVAAVLEGLELEQPEVVTTDVLQDLLTRANSRLEPDELADRLVRQGWLLPLRRRDSWEFAPASRAGRVRGGDPWIEVRGLLRHQPDAPIAVAGESALWERGHSTIPPRIPAMAHRSDWRPPSVLGVRTLSFNWVLPTDELRGLPVWRDATTLVAAAHRPGAQRNWSQADDWLRRAFETVTVEEVLQEGEGRATSTLARLGYLAEWSGRDDVADAIFIDLPPELPVTFLGSRNARAKQWNKHWRVYDALLPG
jgi:hypothetical protein